MMVMYTETDRVCKLMGQPDELSLYTFGYIFLLICTLETLALDSRRCLGRRVCAIRCGGRDRRRRRARTESRIRLKGSRRGWTCNHLRFH